MDQQYRPDPARPQDQQQRTGQPYTQPYVPRRRQPLGVRVERLRVLDEGRLIAMTLDLRRSAGTAMAAAVLTAVLAACGGAAPVAAPATVTVEVPVPAPSAAPAQVPQSWTMPDLVGSGLQDAQDTIQRLTGYGIAITTSHDATGAGRAQVADRNWTVCSQSVAPGTTITPATSIDFGAVKRGEDCWPLRAGQPAPCSASASRCCWTPRDTASPAHGCSCCAGSWCCSPSAWLTCSCCGGATS